MSTKNIIIGLVSIAVIGGIYFFAIKNKEDKNKEQKETDEKGENFTLKMLFDFFKKNKKGTEENTEENSGDIAENESGTEENSGDNIS